MKKKTHYYKSFLIALCTLAFSFCGSQNFIAKAYAAEGELPDYRLGISPSYGDLGSIAPGETYTGSFKVKNMGKKSFEYTISFAPYSVENESYDPSFAKDTRFTEIKNWISTDKESGRLEVNGEDTISYAIQVPSTQHGGAQAGAILVTLKNQTENTGNIETIRQLAYIVYANVDGEIIETGKILDHKVPSFLFNPPIRSTSLVENTGNVYTRATYKLQVFPLFSDEEVYTNEETPDNSIIFPETKRYVETSWDGAPQLGIFRVRSTVKIFDEESVVEKLVFLCPIWFLFIVILMIILIIFWLFRRVIGRKHEA